MAFLAAVSPGPVASQAPPGPWLTLEGARVTVRYQGSDSTRARRALRTIESMRPLPAIDESGLRALLTVAPTREVMDSLVGGRVPEWGAAVAIPGRMEMILPGRSLWPPSPVEEVRILRHEWAHLALAHEMGVLRIPRWFNEGYSEWAAGGWLGGGGWKLRTALAFGGAPALDSITLGWPADRVPAEVAYLLSASVIEYLVNSSGVDGLRAFVREWKRSGTFDGALRTVYGATPAQLEADWRKWVKRRYGWLMVISHSMVFWAILSCGLLAMAMFRRRYRREQMARLRAAEPPDSPAYWEHSVEANESRGVPRP